MCLFGFGYVIKKCNNRVAICSTQMKISRIKFFLIYVSDYILYCPFKTKTYRKNLTPILPRHRFLLLKNVIVFHRPDSITRCQMGL